MLLLIVLRIRPARNVISAPAPRNITLVIRPVDQLVPSYLHSPLCRSPSSSLSLPLPLSLLNCSFSHTLRHLVYAKNLKYISAEHNLYLPAANSLGNLINALHWRSMEITELQLLLLLCRDAVINSAQSGAHSGIELLTRRDCHDALMVFTACSCLFASYLRHC